MKRNGATRRVMVLPALALCAGQARAQDSLTALPRANAHAMQAAADGWLSGAGAETRIAAGRDAQFFLIGEERGVAEIPLIAGTLPDELPQVGYGFAAVVVLSGSGPQHDSLEPR